MKIHEILPRLPKELHEDFQQLFKHFPANAHVIYKVAEPGTTIIEEGAPCAAVFVLISGVLASFWDQPGHCQYLAVQADPLRIVGDLAILCEYEHYTTSMKALERCSFLVINRFDFENWIKKDQELHNRLALINLRMLADQSHEGRKAAAENSKLRILKYINWYYEMNSSENETVILKRKREQMAEDIGGISLRSLNRYISSMENEELFSIVKGKINISQKNNQKIVEKIKNYNQ